MIEQLHLAVRRSSVDKAERLMRQCMVNSMSGLFEIMIEELDWSVNYSGPVKAALLAERAISKAAVSGSNGQGDNPRTGEQPA